MDRRQINNMQLKRERAVYDYLESLEHGDIDGIIGSLQQAIYDAPLDQMLVDAHQAYFQDEQAHKAALVETDTREMPVLEPSTLRSRGPVQRRKGEARQHVRWIQVLAAVLILGVLVGSFITVLALRQQGQQGQHGTPTPQSACQSYPLKQFDAQNNVPGSALINTLTSVTTISPDDAWAVGYSFTAPGLQTIGYDTFIEHWDGKSWQMVPSQNDAENRVLNGVASASANDVWAVGYSADSSDQPLPLKQKTLIEHWDGKSWQIISSPNGPTGNGNLNALAAISQNDVWAVGSFTDTQQLSYPLLEHWDGSRWRIASLQGSDASIRGQLSSIVALSANDIWAVGAGRATDSGQQSSLVMHWDGSQWQSEPAPPGSFLLSSVSAVSTRDLWMTGRSDSPIGNPLIEHWDGQQWSSIALPGAIANLVGELSIAAVSADNAWAVGSVTSTTGSDVTSHMLILHWNGKDWQQVSVPALQLPSSQASVSASGIVASGGQIWIIGSAATPDGEGEISSALILGQRSCP